VSNHVSKGFAEEAFQSRSVFLKKIGIRFFPENRSAIENEKPDRDFSGIVFNRDHHRDEFFKIGDRLKMKNRIRC